MEFPKVKKKLSDILPINEDLKSKTRHISVGILLFAIGGFASPAEPAVSATGPPGISHESSLRSTAKLVFERPSVPPMEMHAQQHYSHYSHSSHASHGSHGSHYSHYSSR